MTLPKPKPDLPLPEIRCPSCGCRDLRVVETRATARGKIRRRRECRNCGRRITTAETVESVNR